MGFRSGDRIPAPDQEKNDETCPRRPGARFVPARLGRPGGPRTPSARRPGAAGPRAELPHPELQGGARVRHGGGLDRRDRDGDVPGAARAARDALARRRGPRRRRRSSAGGKPQKFTTDAGELQARRRPRPARRDRRVGDGRDRVLVQAARRHVLLSGRRQAHGRGLELRRGRAPPRLAADLQRHQRPLRGGVDRDGAEAALGRRQRPARRTCARTRTARGPSTGSRRARSRTTS